MPIPVKYVAGQSTGVPFETRARKTKKAIPEPIPVEASLNSNTLS